MHEIESILKNDDIPIDSRTYFLQFINTSMRNTLSPRQHKNVTVFKDLFIRIDKDIRMFRTFLNLAVDLAQHFKFENTSIVFAFKNISLEEHFTNFVDFARRRNPIIEKNSPLQLFLTLGLSIMRLAFQKSALEHKAKDNDLSKQLLMSQYTELSRGMSERFINMDFGEKFMERKFEVYDNDLDNFNQDEDEDDTTEENVHVATEVTTTADVNIDAIIEEDENESEEEGDNDEEDIEKILHDIISEEHDRDSGFLHDDDEDGDDDDDHHSDGGRKTEVLKKLKNGDHELDLKNLDSLVMNKIGPAVISSISAIDTHQDPIVRFTNPGVKNFVDFISNNN